MPIGGMTFYATALADRNVRQVEADVLLEIVFEEWGALQLPIRTLATLSEIKSSLADFDLNAGFSTTEETG